MPGRIKRQRSIFFLQISFERLLKIQNVILRSRWRRRISSVTDYINAEILHFAQNDKKRDFFSNPLRKDRLVFKGTSNNSQFVTPAPYQVRGKLRRESSNVKNLWIPAFAGMTFLEVALNIDKTKGFVL